MGGNVPLPQELCLKIRYSTEIWQDSWFHSVKLGTAKKGGGTTLTANSAVLDILESLETNFYFFLKRI